MTNNIKKMSLLLSEPLTTIHDVFESDGFWNDIAEATDNGTLGTPYPFPDSFSEYNSLWFELPTNKKVFTSWVNSLVLPVETEVPVTASIIPEEKSNILTALEQEEYFVSVVETRIKVVRVLAQNPLHAEEKASALFSSKTLSFGKDDKRIFNTSTLEDKPCH